MLTVVFYILSGIILISAMHIAFSKNVSGSVFAFIMVIFSVSGFYILLNSQLLPAIMILVTLFGSALFLLLKPELRLLIISDNGQTSKLHYITIIILGVMTALLSSLLGSTRWIIPEINYDINNYTLIFSKYLPLVIFVGLISSVILGSLSYMSQEKSNKAV